MLSLLSMIVLMQHIAAGGLANTKSNDDTSSSINTGLLPSWLGFTATTRQNDLDTSVTISFQPGASVTGGLSGGGAEEHRQAFLTFGDKSWGSVKVGKDLGIFGSTAILNDMTLLGVGSQGIVGAAGGTTTTLGRIGTGYIYADWNGQIAYTTPNMNGFQATLGVMQPWNATGDQLRTAGASMTKMFSRIHLVLLMNLVSKVKRHTHGLVTSLVKHGLVSSHKK